MRRPRRPLIAIGAAIGAGFGLLGGLAGLPLWPVLLAAGLTSFAAALLIVANTG